jgi:hypothetical protein
MFLKGQQRKAKCFITKVTKNKSLFKFSTAGNIYSVFALIFVWTK